MNLAARFLEHGNYVFAEPLSGRTLAEVIPAAVHPDRVEAYFEELGFEGLAVQSVGYEEGRSDGEPPRVHVYVTKGSRKAEREVQAPGGAVKVEIDRVGRVLVRPEMASGVSNRGNVFTHKNRLACGSSCAPSSERYAGTLGALVRKRSGAAMYVLSNNHVLAACNHVPVGMPILSPASMDARPGIRAPGEICRHSEICELRSGVPALVNPLREDVALAEVTDQKLLTSWQGGSDGFDTPGTAALPRSGLKVKKVGRTTGLTTGTVESLLNTPFAIPYKSRFFTATVWFQDVWTVKAEGGSAFALPRDSGSLVVDDTGGTAIGLIFAASPQGDYGFIIPMTRIAGLFGGLTLVARHGT